MESEQIYHLFKIISIGDSGVGKTSLTHRFVNGDFLSDVENTIGSSFYTKQMEINDSVVKAQIWDTAGQERYSHLPLFYKIDLEVSLVFTTIKLQDAL